MLNSFGQKKWIILFFWNTWVHISLQVLWEGNTFIGKEKYIFDDWWKILSFPGGVDSKSCHHSLSISDKCPQLARRNFRVTNTGKDISYMIKHTYMEDMTWKKYMEYDQTDIMEVMGEASSPDDTLITLDSRGTRKRESHELSTFIF